MKILFNYMDPCTTNSSVLSLASTLRMNPAVGSVIGAAPLNNEPAGGKFPHQIENLLPSLTQVREAVQVQ